MICHLRGKSSNLTLAMNSQVGLRQTSLFQSQPPSARLNSSGFFYNLNLGSLNKNMVNSNKISKKTCLKTAPFFWFTKSMQCVLEKGHPLLLGVDQIPIAHEIQHQSSIIKPISLQSVMGVSQQNSNKLYMLMSSSHTVLLAYEQILTLKHRIMSSWDWGSSQPLNKAPFISQNQHVAFESAERNTSYQTVLGTDTAVLFCGICFCCVDFTAPNCPSEGFFTTSSMPLENSCPSMQQRTAVQLTHLPSVSLGATGAFMHRKNQ